MKMKPFPKLVLLAAGLTSATASFVLAADPATSAPAAAASTTTEAKPHPHARLQALQKHHPLAARAIGRRLDLSRDQKTHLKALRQKTAADLRGIRQDSTLSPEQKKAKLHEARQGARAQASGVLTPEQKKQAAKLRHHLRRLAAAK